MTNYANVTSIYSNSVLTTDEVWELLTGIRSSHRYYNEPGYFCETIPVTPVERSLIIRRYLNARRTDRTIPAPLFGQ